MVYYIKEKDKEHWQNLFDQVARLQAIEALKPKKEIDNRPLHWQTLERELEEQLEEVRTKEQITKTSRKIIPFPKIARLHH